MRRVIALARIILGLRRTYVGAALWLGAGVLALLYEGLSGRADAAQSHLLMLYLVGLPVAGLAMPVRWLALSDNRRLMPGHAQTEAILIAGIAVLFAGLGIAVGCWFGLGLATASMLACGIAAFSAWWCVMMPSLWSAAPFCMLVWSGNGPLVWLDEAAWRGWVATLAAVILLSLAIRRIGWTSKGAPSQSATRPVAMDVGWGQAHPTWLDRSGRDCPDAWRGCRRRILQPWDTGRLLLAGFALVLLFYVWGCVFDAVGSGRRNLNVVVLGCTLAATWATFASLLVAGRARRIHRQVLVAPGADRRGVGVRLVDAQIVSSLEMMLALTSGAALASLLLDHHWIRILGHWRSGDAVMEAAAVRAAGTCAMVAALMLACTAAFPPLVAWMLSLAMRRWAHWLLAVLGGLAILFGGASVAMLCLEAWQQHGDARPAILAVVLILAAGAVGRFLAIRRLAVAEPD
jgi:hypothetical protein